MIKKIEKTKNIYVKNYKKVSSIYDKGLLKCVKFSDNKTSKYNLVIICTGNNSDIVKTIFKNHLIKNSYEEFAITTILSHASLKNNTSRQIFLDDEIFALLPISNNQTSIVWTIKKDKKNKNAIFFKKKIKTYAEKYLKKVKFKTKVEYNNLNFLIRNKYYTDRTLLFGDALHVMHPFIGQSFNMTLRDLVLLKKVLKKKIDLGLDIGSADILSEFSDEAKPRNFAFALGSDVIKNFLPLKDVRNNTLKILNKSSFAKDIFFNIANKGFRF